MMWYLRHDHEFLDFRGKMPFFLEFICFRRTLSKLNRGMPVDILRIKLRPSLLSHARRLKRLCISNMSRVIHPRWHESFHSCITDGSLDGWRAVFIIIFFKRTAKYGCCLGWQVTLHHTHQAEACAELPWISARFLELGKRLRVLIDKTSVLCTARKGSGYKMIIIRAQRGRW